jgi:benzoyl-CoA 2,3-dioxygenase component B
MLTEEAHHMFVGESGVSRILERTCQLMKSAGFSEDVRRLGGIDLPTIQRHLNLWYTVSVDLHGNEVSSNAASYFANGLKGRAEERRHEDHKASGTYALEVFEDGEFATRDVSMRNAMNEVLRDWYIADCAKGVERWNRILAEHGIPDRLRLPHRRFNRDIGMYAAAKFDPDGCPISDEEWQRRRDEWLPSAADKAYIRNLMGKPVFETGRFANWIAPPKKGINQKPVDFEYVRTDG